MTAAYIFFGLSLAFLIAARVMERIGAKQPLSDYDKWCDRTDRELDEMEMQRKAARRGR
jgi:hypothetical protein